MITVETYIAAAKVHGENDDPDHEVGDLQDLFRQAYNLLTPKARKQLRESEAARNVFEAAEACIDCHAVPGTQDYGTMGDGYNGRCPSCADHHERKRK